MAIRDKLRKTFNKNKNSSSGDSTPNVSSSPEYYTGRTDIEYYKPHEIPKSKYRGKVDKVHQEQLESYSFVDAFATLRRKSSQALSGIVSPGGTKAQSRRPSYMSRTSRTTRGSVSSVAESEKDGLSNLSRKVTHSGRVPSAGVPRVDEGSNEDLIGNDDELSKQATVVANTQRGSADIPTVRLDRMATVGDEDPKINDSMRNPHGQPFTAAELEQAMTRINLNTENEEVMQRTSISAH